MGHGGWEPTWGQTWLPPRSWWLFLPPPHFPPVFQGRGQPPLLAEPLPPPALSPFTRSEGPGDAEASLPASDSCVPMGGRGVQASGVSPAPQEMLPSLGAAFRVTDGRRAQNTVSGGLPAPGGEGFREQQGSPSGSLTAPDSPGGTLPGKQPQPWGQEGGSWKGAPQACGQPHPFPPGRPFALSGSFWPGQVFEGPLSELLPDRQEAEGGGEEASEMPPSPP